MKCKYCKKEISFFNWFLFRSCSVCSKEAKRERKIIEKIRREQLDYHTFELMDENELNKYYMEKTEKHLEKWRKENEK